MEKPRILNARLKSYLPVKRVEEPLSIAEYKWLGKHYLYEAHTMALLEKPAEGTNEEAFRRLGMQHAWEPQFPHYGKINVQYLCLEACQGCNLRCRYCFVAHEYAGGTTDKLGTKMSFEVAKEAIDTVMDSQATRPGTGFFGGEPLLNWPLIEKVVAYMEQKFPTRQRPPHFHVTTNGTLIDAYIAKFLDKHGFSMIVSIDGPKATHDFNRPMASGKSSFDAVMAGLETIKRVAPQLSTRITLRSTFPWVDRQSTVLEKVAYLNELCDQGYAGWVSVEPAVLTEGCAKVPTTEALTFTVPRVKELIPEYEEVSQWFVERLKRGETPRFHHFSKIIERILYANHATTECGAGKGYMSVGGDRKLYACHREQNSFLGDLGKDYSAVQEKWLDNTFFHRETCPKCKIRYICGGGCREEAIGYYGMEEHGGIPDHIAIRKSYPIMCAFKDIFVRASCYIIGEAGRHLVAKHIMDPFHGKKVAASQRKVYSTNRLPPGRQRVCNDCGTCKCHQKDGDQRGS